MTPSKNRTLPPSDRVTSNELLEALVHWEELDEASLATLATHSNSAARLAGLRRAENWLADGGLLNGDVSNSTCPPAEQLFEYAQGRESAPQFLDVECSVEKHLKVCPECSEWATSLVSRPPGPLLLGAEHEQTSTPVAVHALSRRATWIPLAAAAGLLGIALFPTFRELSPWHLNGAFPAHATVRGTQATAPLFPRGKLLAGTGGAQADFELPAIEGAQNYHVELFTHGPGAFERGEQVQVAPSETPLLESRGLAPGHYTWYGFATVDGLERALGTGQFEVLEELSLAQALAEAQDAIPATNPSATIDLIRKLEFAGFQGDARRLARQLPAGPQRDEYLRGPGR